MSAVAVILARGGSKGLPRKNLRKLLGETLLARAIRTCQQSDACDVVVSTEDNEIAREARRTGARVVDRPPYLAADEADSWDGVRHAIQAAALSGPLALVQCTAPMLTPGDVDGTLAAAQAGEMAVCVQRCHHLLLDGGGRPVNWAIDSPRRQEQPPQYRLAGSVWAMEAEYCLNSALYSGRVRLHEAEHPHQIDIDTEEDLVLARMILRSDRV